jgi:hypothetical protein
MVILFPIAARCVLKTGECKCFIRSSVVLLSVAVVLAAIAAAAAAATLLLLSDDQIAIESHLQWLCMHARCVFL